MITIEHISGERQVKNWPDDADPADYDMGDWTVVATAHEEPRYGAEFVDGAWVVPLALLKAEAIERVKQIRDEREEGVVDIPTLGTFQTNEKSKVKVLGLLKASELLPTLGMTFTESYTRYDNTELALDQTNIRQLALGVLGHVSNVFAHAKQLKAAIEAAADQAELDAIDIESNWP